MLHAFLKGTLISKWQKVSTNHVRRECPKLKESVELNLGPLPDFGWFQFNLIVSSRIWLFLNKSFQLMLVIYRMSHKIPHPYFFFQIFHIILLNRIKTGHKRESSIGKVNFFSSKIIFLPILLPQQESTGRTTLNFKANGSKHSLRKRIFWVADYCIKSLDSAKIWAQKVKFTPITSVKIDLKIRTKYPGRAMLDHWLRTWDQVSDEASIWIQKPKF